MKISVITPTVRPELMGVVAKCLARQTFHGEWEWLVGAPARFTPVLSDLRVDHGHHDYVFVLEPEPKEGDYYGLNRCWNAMFKKAKGELFIFITDGIWFTPDLLGRLWGHYQTNKKTCVGAIGHQYDKVVSGRPEGLVWRDPRVRTDFGTFYEITPRDLEFCVASVPKQAIFDVGGIDEEYDKVAALGEKEMCFRMDQLGYKFFIDQALEYRAIQHPRLDDKWEEKYQEGTKLYGKHLKEIQEGKRLKLDFL